jgi:hypothetical protein
MGNLWECSCKKVARELGKCKFDLVGIQVRWEKRDSEWAEDCTVFYGERNDDHQLGTLFLVLKRIISAVRRAKFVLNVNAPYEDRSNDVKDSFYEELGRVFDHFHRYEIKNLLVNFNMKLGREDASKPTIGNDISQDINNDNGVKSSKLCHT